MLRCSAIQLRDEVRLRQRLAELLEPVAQDNVRMESDQSHGMVRTEVVCNTCDAHLGHMFEDGPAPTGQRYCMNSVSLQLKKEDA